MYQLDRVPGIDAACMGMFGELRSLRDGVACAPDFALSPDLAFRYTRVAIYLIRALAQFQAARRERSDCQTDHVAIGPYRIPTIQVGDSKIRRESQWYNIGFLITFGIAFVSSWIYCIATNGLLVGAGVGFLPCLILAGIAGALWPLVAFVVFLAIVFALKL
jgi:hypothetical protein